MKLQTSTVTSVTKRLLKRRSTVNSRKINPAREWYIGVGVGIMLLALITAWSAYMYISNRTTDIGSNNAEVLAQQPSTYKAVVVEQALQALSGRADRFAQLREGVTSKRPVVEEEQAPATIAESVQVATTATTTPTVESDDIVSDEEVEVGDSDLPQTPESTPGGISIPDLGS